MDRYEIVLGKEAPPPLEVDIRCDPPNPFAWTNIDAEKSREIYEDFLEGYTKVRATINHIGISNRNGDAFNPYNRVYNDGDIYYNEKGEVIRF
jgi:hypothetical protein